MSERVVNGCSFFSTALIHAVQQEQAAVCAYLVEKGADLTATDNDGQYNYTVLVLYFYKHRPSFTSGCWNVITYKRTCRIGQHL
jgi:hypothetical protein